jgi:translation initiation factor 4E
VEDFWAVASHVLTPSYMSNMGDLTFFKKGIRPMWEDAENKNGGSWLHQLSGNAPKGKQQQPEIDEYWMETLMALVGDNFCSGNNLVGGSRDEDEGVEQHICDNISGLFLSHRGRNWKLALWTKNYKDEKTTRLIG